MALAACDQAASPARDEPNGSPPPQAENAIVAPARPRADASAPLIGERIARAEWAKATDKARCAPLALAGDAGGGGTPRRANFSGGWGVAFDRPGLRSAYGFAGPGILPGDTGSAETQRARLKRQWPLMKEIATLPPPSFAGYGLSGAEPYPPNNPEGYDRQSVAYLRVGGQACTYNVWSRISRAHLESLLDNLRLLR